MTLPSAKTPKQEPRQLSLPLAKLIEQRQASEQRRSQTIRQLLEQATTFAKVRRD
jgi:hypothetical protein